MSQETKFVKADEVKVRILLSNAQVAYKVPPYQRPYAWGKDQWEDLFNDIENLSPGDIHFLGSIVVVPESLNTFGVNYYEIVDGQQRLATILIWLAAIRDIAKEKNNPRFANHLTETFLLAKGWEGGREVRVPKLQLGKLDDLPFQRVLNGYPKNGSHLIFDCYKFFKERSSNHYEDLWQKILDNVAIVHINAYKHSNAFRLFETLNDRGLELSAADLIKNFILMKVSCMEDVFNRVIDCWTEMYERVRDKEPVKFVRRYILSTYKGKVSEYRLYEKVRKELENKAPKEILDFMSDLNSKALIYKKICDASFPNENLNKKLRELHLVEVSPSYTLLLKVFSRYEEGQLGEDDILEILNMIEIFHLRWGICGQSTSQLDQIYNEICFELLSKNNPKDYTHIIREALTKHLKTNASDEHFQRTFALRPFRPVETRTKYILWRLSKPTGETHINIKEVHTEHIMPKNLSNGWIEYLRKETSLSQEKIKAQHQDYMNRIGNLTIIKGEWNQSMSNRLFNEKKEKYYQKSEFPITRNLLTYKRWTFDEIDERSRKFAEEALRIWYWK